MRVISHQIKAHEDALKYAKEHPDTIVILISDRSLVDADVFLSTEEKTYFRVDRAFSYDAIYDRVYFFQFSADFLSDANANNNSERVETDVAQFTELAEKTKSSYFERNMISPEKITVIPPFENHSEKLEYVGELFRAEILSLLEVSAA